MVNGNAAKKVVSRSDMPQIRPSADGTLLWGFDKLGPRVRCNPDVFEGMMAAAWLAEVEVQAG